MSWMNILVLCMVAGPMEDEPVVKTMKQETFDAESAQRAMVVDFYADWCPPCRELAPLFEEVAEELKGQVAFGKVNIAEGQDLFHRFDVTRLPTLVLLKDGKEVRRLVGLHDRAALLEFATSGES